MSELFLTVLNMSIMASYVILFVILIRLPLKKAPKVISYALWGVVAFRLIIPFSFESMFSLMPQKTNAVPIPHDIIYQQSPKINSGIQVVDSFVNQSLPAPTVGASVNPLQIYTEIGAYIWILGIVVLLIYSVMSVLLLKRQLKSAQLIDQNIFEAKNLKTPFVLGLIKPKIYLPVGLNVEERGYILLHEQTHIQRKDHIIKILAFLALSIHWFNPLVWIAFMLMSTDMELSCDEQVLKKINEDIKKPYANSLLSLATGKHILNGSPLAFGEGNIRWRIKNVLNYEKPKFWVAVISIIIVTAVGIGLMLNPRAKEIHKPEQVTDLAGTINKDIANHESNPEAKRPSNNSNEKTGVSIGEENVALKALRDFYGQTDEPIVIYEQTPFDNDYMLVLADRMTQGEHYPNLYLVSSNGMISELTRHSNCWTLNFTELNGYKVFFGLAGNEVNQDINNSISVNKVEAIFGNKVEMVETRKSAYAYYNLDEKEIGTINNAHGYILISKNLDMPENVIGILDGGHKVSLSQTSIDRNLNYMPLYLDSTDKSIYNSFAFTYSPMISPAYWSQIDSEGEVGLKGGTDENGNMNAVSLRPSRVVFKTIHSSEIPSDINAFYHSNSYPWTATFAAGENAEVVYSTETELYDCHVLKLTPQSVDKKIGIKELKQLSVNDKNQIILPKESGNYLFVLRTEKHFELRSYIGVINIY